MKELSTEIINIDGVDYTLFLNRAGIAAWEKYTKNEKHKMLALQEKYKNVTTEFEGKDFEKLADDTNPFDGLEDIESMDSDVEYMKQIYGRLYWIMLYTHHKLSISEAKNLYEKACEEYGDEQVILLARQMIEDVNTNPNKNEKLKNLAALKPKKN